MPSPLTLGPTLSTSDTLLMLDQDGVASPFREAVLRLDTDGTVDLGIRGDLGPGAAEPTSQEEEYTWSLASGACELDVAAVRSACGEPGELRGLLERLHAVRTAMAERGEGAGGFAEEASRLSREIDRVLLEGWHADRWLTPFEVRHVSDWMRENDTDAALRDAVSGLGLGRGSTHDDHREVAESIVALARSRGVIVTGDIARHVATVCAASADVDPPRL